MAKNNTGVLGIEYEVDVVTNKSDDDDWVSLIKEDSDGLTKTGRKLSNSPWSPTSTRVGYAGTDQVAHRRTGSQVPTDPRHLPQTRERYRHSGRSREGHLEHEVGDKGHERGFEPRHLTRFDTIPLGHDHPEGKGRGV